MSTQEKKHVSRTSEVEEKASGYKDIRYVSCKTLIHLRKKNVFFHISRDQFTNFFSPLLLFAS